MTKNFSNFFTMNLAVKKFFLVGFFDQNFFYNEFDCKNFFRQKSAVKNSEIFFNEFGCKNFFQHISKNGLRMALGRLVKALEKTFFLTTSTFQK